MNVVLFLHLQVWHINHSYETVMNASLWVMYGLMIPDVGTVHPDFGVDT